MEWLDRADGTPFDLADLEVATRVAVAATATARATRLERDAGRLLRDALAALASRRRGRPGGRRASTALVGDGRRELAGSDPLWRLADRIGQLRDADPDDVDLAVAWLDALVARDRRRAGGGRRPPRLSPMTQPGLPAWSEAVRRRRARPPAARPPVRDARSRGRVRRQRRTRRHRRGHRFGRGTRTTRRSADGWSGACASSSTRMGIAIVEDPDGIDLVGHGTACAGIIHGIAPAADLVSIRVLGADNRAGDRPSRRPWNGRSSRASAS